ncbi:MAG TPA: M20/M25/M40 family metallo-hydrolase [Conexibacter sp.]|nr:M20/M25/M40 family metallo-hydrolase [Conexibacter sp.]
MDSNGAQKLRALRDHVERHRARHLDLLDRYVATRGVSATGEGVEQAARFAAELLARVGLDARVHAGTRHPLVIARSPRRAGRRTVLVYGHYDVQPAGPREAWHSDPFRAVVRDGRIYGRGTADNKAQHLAHVLAIEALTELDGAPPCDMVVLLDGEEEIGSPSLDADVLRHRDELRADLALWSDGPVGDPARPQVTYGVRGIVLFELRARGAKRPLHSGNWGGVAPDPATQLVALLASMRDADGAIAVDGFLDGVEPPSAEEAALLARFDRSAAAAMEEIGVTRLAPPASRGIAERLSHHPTLTINALRTDGGAAGARPVIPADAIAECDARLVRGQRTAHVIACLQRHVARVAPDVQLTVSGTMEPALTPLGSPYGAPIRAGVARATGIEPAVVPALGGALPLAPLVDTLGLPCFGIPLANPDAGNHGPNENIELDRFLDGIVTAATVLREMAAWTQP